MGFFLARIVSIFAVLLAGAAQAQVEVVFMPLSRADAYDTGTYRAIWAEHGERIVTALEQRTCLPFSESHVSATVAEATSNSGGPEHAMRLRASYRRAVKQSTLVHELGHRHLWQLEERLDDVDGHMTLYLILDRVWADVWGEEFAEERIRGETEWDEDYKAAWDWAQSLEPDERARLWNRLLRMNGILDRCESLLDGTA
ncbi:MAG: hypothetical protein OEQ25_10030 [Gammaproteobacteria bacterium]|nr:hypothetical protein [Gammaproteobacteria bacterium]MDH3507464.1 hypothetical protein [Gammaproteobacteria bacterium]